MNGFNGLYFPGESWDCTVEDSVLKKCLLYFDKTYAIIPEIFASDWQDIQPVDEANGLVKIVRPIKEQMIREAQKKELNIESKHELARYFRITKFMDKIDILRKENIIEILNPRENLLKPPYWEEPSRYPWMHVNEKYNSILASGIDVKELNNYSPFILYGSILCDLKNTEFRKITHKLGHDRIILYKGQA